MATWVHPAILRDAAEFIIGPRFARTRWPLLRMRAEHDAAPSIFVMAGLRPGHPRLPWAMKKDVDARDKRTAVRFDFCGQGAWRGFFCVLSASHTFETPKEVRAMRHQNSVFHSLTKHIPWTRFDQIVEKYGADEFARKLTTKRQFIALLYGQLSGSTSLREVVTGMASHETRLYHVGATPVRRSTMSDANSKRPWQVFSELFAQMLPQAHRGLRRTTADAVRLIDSTSVRLSSLSEGWATFSTDVFGAKVHIVYDPNADRPVYFAVTPAKVNDITAAKAMPIEPGATYVYDLGYYDYGWWAGLDEAGWRFGGGGEKRN